MSQPQTNGAFSHKLPLICLLEYIHGMNYVCMRFVILHVLGFCVVALVFITAFAARRYHFVLLN